MGRGAKRRVPRSGNGDGDGRWVSGTPAAARFGFAEHAFGVPHPSRRCAAIHLPLQGRTSWLATIRWNVAAAVEACIDGPPGRGDTKRRPLALSTSRSWIICDHPAVERRGKGAASRARSGEAARAGQLG